MSHVIDAAIESVDVRMYALLPDGWTQEELWDALVAAGNDPDLMERLDDGRIKVLDTFEELTDG